MWKLKLCVTSQRAILGGLLYLLMINERFYKISFSSQILATVIFCFSSISTKRAASNVCKPLFTTTCYRSWLGQVGENPGNEVGGWLASGAEICLFHGRVVEKTRLHKAFWRTILFHSSSILEAKARIFVWHWTKSLSAWSYSNFTVSLKFSQSTSR